MPTARAQIGFDNIENRLQRVTPKFIRAVCDWIVEKIRPEKIVLFGSFAKGMATKDSDLDLIEKARRSKNFVFEKAKELGH